MIDSLQSTIDGYSCKRVEKQENPYSFTETPSLKCLLALKVRPNLENAALKSRREGNMLILVDFIYRINLDLRAGGSGVVTVIPFKIKGDSYIGE